MFEKGCIFLESPKKAHGGERGKKQSEEVSKKPVA